MTRAGIALLGLTALGGWAGTDALQAVLAPVLTALGAA